MLSFASLLMVLISGFFMALVVFILGRLRVKIHYLAIFVSFSIFVIVLLAFYMNDHTVYISSLVFAGLTSISCGAIAYFALGMGLGTKKKKVEK